MILDFFSMALTNLRRRRSRSWLTILGIVIGIIAIVALISLGQGLNDFVAGQFEQLGANKIVVLSGITSATLNEKDVEAIEDVDGVRYTYGSLVKRGFASFHSDTQSINLMGLESNKETLDAFIETTPIDFEGGRFLETGESRGIVVGWKIAYDTFENDLEAGREISIRDRNFKIVGILKKTGSFIIDNVGITSLKDMGELFETKESYSRIFVDAREGEDLEELTEEIKKELREARDVEKGSEDFSVESAQDVAESFSNVMGTIQWFLIGIASISLLVGIIGIMNTMYISVIERKKEIGIMKALGARNSHVSLMFLLESGIIGLVGGVIGTALGVLLSMAASSVISQYVLENFAPSFSLELILLSLALSFLMGIIAGTWPAYQASKQNPVKIPREE